MGNFMPEGSLIWCDSGVMPRLGDMVLIEVPYGGAPVRYAKVLQRIGGRLWGLSEDAPLPIIKGMRIIGPLVAAVTVARPHQAATAAPRDHELYAELLRHAAPMLAHFARHGFDQVSHGA
jgi:hypothetical protein